MSDLAKQATSIVSIFILIAMLIIPTYLSEKYVPDVMAISIENHDSLLTYPNSSFPFVFKIQNLDDSASNMEFVFIKETGNHSELIQRSTILLSAQQEMIFAYTLDKPIATTKYSVILPQTGQKIHFWIKATEDPKSRNSEEIYPYLPWELQDPYLQAHYRYG